MTDDPISDVATIAVLCGLVMVMSHAAYRLARPGYRMPELELPPDSEEPATEPRFDPETLTSELLASIERHQNHTFGIARAPGILVTARWVTSGWADRWESSIVVGTTAIPIQAYSDESLLTQVLAQLQQVRGEA